MRSPWKLDPVKSITVPAKPLDTEVPLEARCSDYEAQSLKILHKSFTNAPISEQICMQKRNQPLYIIQIKFAMDTFQVQFGGERVGELD